MSQVCNLRIFKWSQNFLYCLIPLLSSCGTAPTETQNLGPDWTRQPARTVDNGYLVYVGSAAGPSETRATFKAEGLALEDLANECSLLPTETRIEDHFVRPGSFGPTVFVKIGVPFEACGVAQKAFDSSRIRDLANAKLTQQLRRYQDFQDTNEIETADEMPAVDYLAPPSPLPPPGPQVSDSVHFSILRQYVLYQKELVILSPPAAFAPSSPESRGFASATTPAAQKLAALTASHPEFLQKPLIWSQIPDRPRLEKPMGMRSQRQTGPQLRPPNPPPPPKGSPSVRPKGQGRHRGHSRAVPKSDGSVPQLPNGN